MLLVKHTPAHTHADTHRQVPVKTGWKRWHTRHPRHSNSFWWFIISWPLSVMLRGHSWGVIGRIIESLYIQTQPIWFFPYLGGFITVCAHCRLSTASLTSWTNEPTLDPLYPWVVELFCWASMTLECNFSLQFTEPLHCITHTHTHTWLCPYLFWHCCWFHLTVHSIK